MSTISSRGRAWLIAGAAAAGIALGAAGVAGAATGGTSTTTPSSGSTSGAPTQPAPRDPATMSHGPNETLLTGTTAEKVKAAALAAQPGATVIRVETDSEGSPYEAHLRTSAGKEVTVKVDASFKVTATEDGFGGGRGGRPGHGGPNGSGADRSGLPGA